MPFIYQKPISERVTWIHEVTPRDGFWYLIWLLIKSVILLVWWIIKGIGLGVYFIFWCIGRLFHKRPGKGSFFVDDF